VEVRSRSRLPRGLAAALVGVLVILSAGGTAVHAAAPSISQAGSAVEIAGSPVETVSAYRSDGEASVQSVISCYLYIDNPHRSTHQPSTTNTLARWICSQPVARLTLRIYVYRNDIFVTESSAGNSGRARVQANATTRCVSGTYQGIALASVVFPPGYEPPTDTADDTSNSVYISCA
jgi:hypothetical protein